jgi:hypothetical protein
MSTVASTGGGQQSTGAPASTGAAQQSTAAAASGWGDDWRTRMAAGSTDPGKEAQQLARYESPEQVWRKARELERKISSGEYRTTLPKGASPEETARWRTENAIPAKPEDYKINMPAGRQAPKEDDGFLKSFLKSAHDAHYTQAQLDAALTTFYAEVDNQQNLIADNERKLSQETEDKLRQEWGADYRPNKAMAEALLARAPDGFRDRFLNGYLADHTPIKASADAWKWLVQMEREINPAATVVPGAGGDLGKTIATELGELKALMGNPNSKYWKGPEAEKLQERYRQLLAADEKLKAKAAA